jgi:RNA polymerase sigma-70 factor (ECF subfamily)
MSGSVTGAGEARADAFRVHVQPEIEGLLRVAMTLTGSWADAEDLVQETLVRAWRSLDRFDGRHPRAWLLTILRNTNVNMHRKRRPDVVEAPSELRGARPAFGASTSPGPEEQFVSSGFDADLELAVNGLDARFRTVLLLVGVDQLSYAEAATALGVPIGTVMSRLSRARKRVRAQLRDPHRTAAGDRP